jgi:hypothetical protein
MTPDEVKAASLGRHKNSFDNLDAPIKLFHETMKLAYLHIESAPSIPDVHSNLLTPKFPPFPPFSPGFF